MEIAITKRRNDDLITVRRIDGSVVETTFPKKSRFPHDAVHFFVERGLGLHRAFWGTVARGVHPEEIADMAKAAGHASAKRFRVPDTEIVELLQAERIVECLEADLWSGGGASPDDLLDLARVACASSHVPLPAIDAVLLAATRDELAAFALEWLEVPDGHTARFAWNEGNT